MTATGIQQYGGLRATYRENGKSTRETRTTKWSKAVHNNKKTEDDLRYGFLWERIKRVGSYF